MKNVKILFAIMLSTCFVLAGCSDNETTTNTQSEISNVNSSTSISNSDVSEISKQIDLDEFEKKFNEAKNYNQKYSVLKDFYDNVQNTKSHEEFKGLLESELFHNISSVDNDLDKKSLRKYKTRLLPLAYTLEEVEYISEKLNVSYTLETDGCVNMAFVGMDEKNNFKSYVNGENKIFNIINSEDAKNSTFVIFTSCDEKDVDCLVENIRIMRKNKRACSIEMDINTYEVSSKDKKLERKL